MTDSYILVLLSEAVPDGLNQLSLKVYNDKRSSLLNTTKKGSKTNGPLQTFQLWPFSRIVASIINILQL